ncbi:hypothetical protein LWI29_016754 [Acer saccharum]|uniref:Uncharacterized protein n=1 Tax=Acer saccharum TaxID=4024 RepID=A0AA39SNK4_ACESA|nr:hypothetical protein LWI29_016754 [Acer saccharum]
MSHGKGKLGCCCKVKNISLSNYSKPPAPNNESSIMYRDEYEQWKTSDDMAKCYIMATISDVLQQQHEGMESAADIMMSLEEMFAIKSRTTKREAVTAFMNLRMKPGQAVKDHMMKVIAHLNIAELHGAEIDGETKIDGCQFIVKFL